MKPAYQIVADGADITALIRDRLIRLSVSDEAGWKSDQLELVIDNRDGRIALPANGALITVAMGYEGSALVAMGEFISDEVTITGPERVLTIRAKPPNMEGTIKEQKSRNFDGKTIRQIIEQIAGEHGLTAAVASRHAGFTYRHLAQNDESDLHLLTRIASAHDAVASVKDGRLIFAERGAGTAADGAELPVHLIRAGQITSWRATLSARTRYGSVIAHYQDRKLAKLVEVKEGEDAPAYRLRHPFANREEAERAAKAKYDELARGTNNLSIIMPGRPIIAAESRLLAEIDPLIDGLWSIGSVRHVIDSGGFSTSLEAEKPND